MTHITLSTKFGTSHKCKPQEIIIKTICINLPKWNHYAAFSSCTFSWDLRFQHFKLTLIIHRRRKKLSKKRRNDNIDEIIKINETNFSVYISRAERKTSEQHPTMINVAKCLSHRSRFNSGMWTAEISGRLSSSHCMAKETKI